MIRRVKPVPVSRARHHCNLILLEIPEAHYGEPHSFRCHNCGQKWTAKDMHSGFDVSKVTCSNCYSDAVSMTAIKVVMWKEKA